MVKQKRCLFCKKILLNKDPNQKCCSQEHWNKYQHKYHPIRKKISTICEFCGKKFFDYHKEKITHCSRKCRFDHMRIDKTLHPMYGRYKRKEKKCLQCGKKIIVRYSEPDKFCSRKCYFIYLNINKHKHPNYRGGKFIFCSFCKKKFWMLPHRKINQKHYCSTECYKKDPMAMNIKLGNKNPMAKEKYREKVRIKVLEYIKREKCFGGCKFMCGKNEKQILDAIEMEFNIYLIRHYEIGGYCIDGYSPELNICFEVDEKYHTEKRYRFHDRKREKNIKKKLRCKFIRIKDYVC
jgi:hypothetical protein